MLKKSRGGSLDEPLLNTLRPANNRMQIMKAPLTDPSLTAGAEATGPIFNVAILYESSAAEKRANVFSDQLVTGVAAERVLSLSHWNFHFLAQRDVRNAAASAAAEADIVILSMSGKTPLPAPVEHWVEMWTWLIDGSKPSVVALFESGAPESARIRSYLRRGAVRKGLRFHPQIDGTPMDTKCIDDLLASGSNVTARRRQTFQTRN